MYKLAPILLSISLILAGCGGGGGGGSSTTTSDTGSGTATGQFKDSNVSGLQYTSGSISGITDSEGHFTYEAGQPVTFFVGGVTIGSTAGKAVVTPLDLVPNGTTSSMEVLNIVRFLLILDEDVDETNGIQISDPMRSIAEFWDPIDFTDPDIDSRFEAIRFEVMTQGGPTLAFPTMQEAREHIESTVLCLHAGIFRGTFDGDDRGIATSILDAKTGHIRGFGFSYVYQTAFALDGISSVDFDNNLSFVSGNSSTGATFSGSFSSPDAVSGTWNNVFSSESGGFEGSRITEGDDAVYRFTGLYGGGGDLGAFSFDVDDTNGVSGIVYSVSLDEKFTLTGSVSNDSLSATASNGTTINGNLNKLTGLLAGTWRNNAIGVSGSFRGSGCRLNNGAN